MNDRGANNQNHIFRVDVKSLISNDVQMMFENYGLKRYGVCNSCLQSFTAGVNVSWLLVSYVYVDSDLQSQGVMDTYEV